MTAEKSLRSKGSAWRRLTRLVPIIVALALALSACTSGRTLGAGSAIGSKVAELRSVSGLRDRFNKDSGRIRLILLISPT